MTRDLDARGRSAAEAVRRAVADVPLPAAPAPPRRSRAPLAAAAAVLLVLGLVAATLALRGEPRADLAIGGPDGVPRLILDPVPAGLEPTGAVDLPLPDAQLDPEGTLWLYGDGDADDPMSGDDLGIISIRSDDGGLRLPRQGERTEVGGRAAVIVREDEVAGEPARVTVRISGGHLVTVASNTLPAEVLLAVAGQLDVGTGEVVLPSSMPSGLDLVATVSPGSYMAVPPLLIPLESGHLVGYQDDGDLARAVAVAAVAVDPGGILAARWSLGPEAREIELRGTAAWIASPYEGGRVVVWEEAPGVLVGVTSGLSEDATIAAIESLRLATDEEWAAFPTGGEVEVDAGDGTTSVEVDVVGPEDTVQVPGSSGEVLAQGMTAGGESWSLTLGAGPGGIGGLCLGVEITGTITSEMCGAGGREPVVFDDVRAPTFVFGEAPEATEQVQVVHADGATSDAGFDGGWVGRSGGRTYYVVEVPEGDTPTEVGHLDGAGQVIGNPSQLSPGR
jgi:hypothetical protein